MSNPNIVLRRPSEISDKRLHFPAAPYPHGIQMIFKKYDYKSLLVDRDPAFGSGFIDRTTRTKAAQEASASIIELPMPTALQDSTGLMINGFERTFVESFVSDALAPAFSGEGGGFQDAANALFGMGEGAVQGAADLIGVISDPSKAAKDSQLGQLAAQGSKVLTFFMRNTLNNMGLGKSINAATGQAVNPQSTLSFEGVNLRSFQMDWTLYPESEGEATDIKNIIRTIKREILPRTQSLTGDIEGGGNLQSSLARAFLEYPSVCFINLLGIDESSFIKFKPCMVDSISVDYGPSGAIVIAQGGVPQGVKISMSFKELEIQTAEDFEDNNSQEQQNNGN
tara:strand:- start:984 stop:2000 length:1017 start_codon:yes stop_codon:yes gene_type:complete